MLRQSENRDVFRVLSLDGGGVRGIFTASFLTTLEEMSQTRLADNFDLIVGTSTGGIVGLTLAIGMPARRTLDLYLDRCDVIFGRQRRLGMLLRPKYDNTGLARTLKEVFDQKILNDVITPVCITSYELTSSYPRVWKDDHLKSVRCGDSVPLWKIALATSAAPVYFPGTRVLAGDSHVDGGLFANNPTLIGLTEAARYFDQPLDRIRILSVGAGERSERIPYERARRMGVWQWRTAFYDQMLIAQAQIAHEVTQRLLEPGQYERVNIPLEQTYPIDDCRAARTLIEPGAHAARTRFLDIRDRFLFGPATIGRDQKTAVMAAHQKIRR